jgi:Transposase DDE domain/Domain of unknown function (DUF4372)
MKSVTPTRGQYTILKQLCELIPAYMASNLAKAHGVASRGFKPWSHVVAMIHAHLTHAVGLNDVCDGLRNNQGKLVTIRGAEAPSRNGLSNANKTRSSEMAKDLFWATLKHLESIQPGFGGHTYKGFPRRFKRSIKIADSTTMALVANCMDWAKHRRRKAAAKMHMLLDLKSFLPSFAIVDTAKHNDAGRARELCAGLKSGEITIFDKAYVDFDHLHDLNCREVFWVTRAKDNMDVRCVKRLIKKPTGNILRDDVVVLSGSSSFRKYPEKFRRVVAMVEVDGELREMTFITNNLEWTASSICDLYKCRWSIEAFFKQLKQTLQLCSFLGHSRNAIRWQVWTALLTHLLLQFLRFISQWNHSFIRLFTMIRGVLWSKLNLADLLKSYGTAGGSFRMLAAPEHAYFPGFVI